jgi:hypothetical protein
MKNVTNNSKKVVRRAATDFKPGTNEFPDNKFTTGDIAQINKHQDLSVNHVTDVPATSKGAK